MKIQTRSNKIRIGTHWIFGKPNLIESRSASSPAQWLAPSELAKKPTGPEAEWISVTLSMGDGQNKMQSVR